MFVALDTTFAALAEVARPFWQDSITEGLATQLVTQEEAPRIRPFLYASARFSRALLPGAIALGKSAPIVNSSFDIGIPVLRSSPRLNDQLAPTARSLRLFGESTQVNNGLDTLIDTNKILKPLLSKVTPSQNTCNYLALLLRNVQDYTSTGNDQGRFVRAISVLPPIGVNAEGVPAAAPANGGGSVSFSNHLHANPYPYTASPGEPRICAAGNEVYAQGQQVIGNGTNFGSEPLLTFGQSEKQLSWGE